MVNYPIHEKTILKHTKQFDAKYSSPLNIFVSALPILIHIKRMDLNRSILYSSWFLTMPRHMISSHQALAKNKTLS